MAETGFLLAEDEAIKLKLSGLTVIDTKHPTGNTVGVFYGFPDRPAENRWPFITIDLISVDHAREMQSSDQPINPTYWPDTTTDATTLFATPLPAGMHPTSYEYIPVWLTYQIMTWSRNAQHDRQIHARLLATQRIPMRWGYLNVPADGTTRRLELLSRSYGDSMERMDSSGKRSFRTAYTVRTNAELTPFALMSVQEVATVSVTLQAYIGNVVDGEGPYT